MYPIGTMYFFVTYWFDKICLMRYYQKTKEFNEELPIESIKLFKYAIVIHYAFAAIMYSGGAMRSGKAANAENFEQVDYRSSSVFERFNSDHMKTLLGFAGICLFFYLYQVFCDNPVTLMIK
jgi:hypothetical protein